jgi:CIC family chloride channel protein
MAAVLGGTTHAPLTAIVMLYEMTREPRIILPVMFAVIVSTFGAQLLCRDSIYTLKLRRRGVRFGTLADLTILKRIAASDVMKLAAPVVRREDPLQKLIEIAGETEAVDFVVVDDESVYQGMVMGKDLRTALLQPEAVSLLLVGELMRPSVPTVHPGETLDAVLDKFASSEVDSLPLCNETDSTQIDGLITRQAVMMRYHQELDR